MKMNKPFSISYFFKITGFLGLTKQTFLIFNHAIKVNVKTKRYIIAFIILLFPVLLRAINIQNEIIVEKSNSIAMYHLQLQLYGLTTTWWLGLLGELMIIVLASDIISGELENETLHALYLRPVRNRDIIFGKYLATLTLVTSIQAFGVITSAIIEAKTYGADNTTLLHASDEILYTILVLLINSGLIIILTELFSTMTGKTLQTVLISIALVIGIAIIAPLFGLSQNAIDALSLQYYASAMLKPAYFNLDFKTDYFLTPFQAVMSFIGLNIILLILSTYFLSLKELP